MRFGSHTFVPMSWMCKKQTSVSHSSTESEIISLDTGLRLDGLLALELWDLIVSILGNVSRVSDGSGKPESDVYKRQKSHNKIDEVKDIDLVPSNVQSANSEALLYVFEDTEAVIKMIMKGRSPTMRHVSRTHRVALDWLFDRINLDPKIQIKFFDTKNQLEDILTKGSFTRDEWNHLLTLFNISHFSSIACIAAMAKRAQQDSGEGRVTAKSRPTMNLTARTPSFVSSSASANPEKSSYGYQDPEQPVLDDRAGNPSKRQDQTTLRIMVHPGLLKCGKVEMESTIDQGNLSKILGIHWRKLTLIVKNIFSAGQRILQGTKKLFTKERGNALQRMSKERLIVKSSSREVTQQNLSIKSGTKCEFDRKECQMMQKIVPNIRYLENVYGYNIECSDIHGKELFNDAECCAE